MATASRGTTRGGLWSRIASLLVGCLASGSLLSPIATATPTGRVSGEYITSMYWSTLLDIVVIDNFAYCGSGLGLAVIDLSVPSDPVWLTDYYLGGAGHHIVAEGQYVFLAHYNTIYVFDVSSPSHPALVSQFSLPGTLNETAVSGGIFVAADNWNHYVHIVDVSDPSSPRILGKHYTQKGPEGVDIHDSVVYATVGRSAIHTIDISDPAQPVVLGVDSAAVQNLVIDYPHLYGFDNGLHIWDVSHPEQPQLVYQDSGLVKGVMVDGNRAYVQDFGTLRVLDVTDPTAPRTVAQKVHGGWPIPKGMLGTSTTLVAYADIISEPRFRVIDVADTLNLPEVGSWRFDNFFTRVKAYKEWLFAILARSGELHVFDIRNPVTPVLSRTMPELGRVHDFAIRNDTLYTCGLGVRAADISDPRQPRLLSELNSDTTYRAIQLKDTLVYVSKQFGLHVVSFRDLAQPSLIGTYTTTDHTYQWGGLLELEGSFAYIDHWIWEGRQDQKKIVQKLDISNPTSPALAGVLELPLSLNDLEVRSGIGYAIESRYLYLIDLSTPSGPSPILKVLPIHDYSTIVSLHEDMAYVGNALGGLTVVDVAEPLRAEAIGTFDPGAGGTGYIEIVDSIAYVAAGHGFVVARLAINPASNAGDEVLPEAFHLEQNYPNPFNAGTSVRYTLPTTGTITLSVFDVLGRHVVTLANGTQTPGAYAVTWDGRNTRGQKMGSGVYFCRLRFGEGEMCRKMLLLK